MKSKNKRIIAWIILIILLIMILILNYVKFFGFYNYEDEIETTPIDNSTSEAINIALTDIVNNFNSASEITTYKEQGINLNATLKNNSIFISITTDTTTTYEFTYNNLLLSINISNNQENLDKFNLCYRLLIKSIQKRIKNESNIDSLINPHITDSIKLVGINKIINSDETITYKIDITKKIEIEEGE